MSPNTLCRRLCQLAILALLLTASRPASALGTGIAYTGQLLAGSSTVTSGSYDLQFTLYNAATGGTQVGSTLTKTSVPVAGGVFYVELDFGSVFTGTTLYLQTAYRVHPSSGSPAYTTQSPRKLFTTSANADYAAVSGSTKALQGFPVSAIAPTDGQVLTWTASGDKWLPQTPLVPPAYTAGTGLSLSGTTFSVATGGITNTLLGAGSVGPSKITSGAISGDKLALPLTASASSSSDLFTLTNTGGGRAIVGNSASNTAVKGVGHNGVYGSGTHYGVQADGTNYGVYSTSPAVGVYGINTSSSDYGLLGGTEPISGQNFPVGVYGNDDSGFGYGVYGISHNGFGVYGYCEGSSEGVFGNSTYGIGTFGTSTYGYGVYGTSNNDIGVYGTSNNDIGVYGYSGNGDYAGYFQGNVIVTGTLAAAVKDFRIDHPLDPAHQYLSHASIESDQMLDLYSGHVTLDASGAATVTMPNWFQSLNTEFEYHLTPIGAPGPNLYIAQKVNNNHFQIAGGQPGAEVSWQVTGVRHDAFALAHPLQVEEDKPKEEQGLYQNPEAFGKSEEKGINYKRLHTVHSQLPTPTTATAAAPPVP